jgi:manganese-dependent inorganic pyrophosphatase
MQGGIISDTLLLRSPTSCERDRRMLEKLEKITGVKSEELMHEIFSIGSVIAKNEPEKLFLADSKNFTHLERFNFTISQVEEVSFDEFYNRKDDLLNAAKEFLNNRRLDLFGLLVTNVEQENSIFLAVGSQEILENLPFRKLSDNLYDLPGVLSRKKQLLPQILKLLDSLI